MRRSEPQIRADGPGIWQLEKREEVYEHTRVQAIEEFAAMFAFMSPRVKKLYMLTGSTGNVQNAREEQDWYESVEAAQAPVGGVIEAKRMIAAVQQTLTVFGFCDMVRHAW